MTDLSKIMQQAQQMQAKMQEAQAQIEETELKALPVQAWSPLR